MRKMKDILGKFKTLNFNKYKPGVHKKYLLIISGLMWTGVGIFLASLTYKWLFNYNKIIYYGLGLLLALLIHRFGFSFIANQNIKRVLKMEKTKACIFAFQPWYSYGIVIFMMSLGMFMRNSFIPKNYLAILYFGIGGALFLSSLKYYNSFFKDFTNIQAQP